MKIIDNKRDYSGSEIVKVIQKKPSVIFRNVRVIDDFILDYDQKVDNLIFENVEFMGKINIDGSKGKITFRHSIFYKYVNFYLCSPQELEFWACQFEDRANFHSVETSEFWLNESVFRDHAVLVNMSVKGMLNLADVCFERTVDFSGTRMGQLLPTRVRSSLPIQILWSQFGRKWLEDSYKWALAPSGEERMSRLRQIEMSLQFWRRNFVMLGHKRGEIETNYEIIKLRRTYFMNKKSINWWASIILEIPSRYGSRPFRPLMFGLVVVLMFGLIYLVTDPFTPNEGATYTKDPLFAFAILYSLDTFVPLINITGIDEWGWTVTSNYHWIVLIERIMGLVISTLAVYSISKNVLLTKD